MKHIFENITNVLSNYDLIAIGEDNHNKFNIYCLKIDFESLVK